MKHLLTFFTALLLGITTTYARSMEGWKYYFSYSDATNVVDVDGTAYAVANGNLFSYDSATGEVRTYERSGGYISSKGIALMKYSASQRVIVLVYKDGNIDIFDPRTKRACNIPHYHDDPDPLFGLNNLCVQDDDGFLCTQEGLVWISLSKCIIKGRFNIGATMAAACYDGNIFVSMAGGGIKQIGKDDNLNDKECWKNVSDLYVSDMDVAFDQLYLCVPYNSTTSGNNSYGLWCKNKEEDFARISGRSVERVNICKEKLVAYHTDGIVEISKDAPRTACVVATKHGRNNIAPDSKGGYWTAANGTGITHAILDDAGLTPDGTDIIPDGPSYESPYFLKFVGDRLLMAAGRLDPNDQNHTPYKASWLDTDGDWQDFEAPVVGGPWLRKNHDFADADCIAQDPFDPNHHFITSGRQGLFEYRNGKIVAQYTEGNSPLRSVSGSRSLDYVRCESAIFDAEGNLFLSNNAGGANAVDALIWCRKRDGQWIGFNHKSIEEASHFENSIFDTKGRLWICQRRFANNFKGGFLCLDFNGTLGNTGDDVYTYRTDFVNQDGTAFSYQEAYAIAQDKNGSIWLGTSSGLLVCDNPDEWSNKDFLITQVKVPRNDGTNYADYLLDGVAVTAIAVDGANRKWIGTDSDGLYFVNEKGDVILAHYTAENSLLPSNCIWSIACHPTTGEVFIGTDHGLVSYQSDASEGLEVLHQDNLRVYPNPVRPDYSGPIVLDGLVADTDVKVVSTSGHVVAGGTSNGGTFTWDGRGPSGERIGSGIYYFMVATPDGKTATVAKVAVVR